MHDIVATRDAAHALASVGPRRRAEQSRSGDQGPGEDEGGGGLPLRSHERVHIIDRLQRLLVRPAAVH